MAAGAIPLRPFGRSSARVSALGLGGHYLGAAAHEQTAIEIVDRTVHGSVNFFDCCSEYNRGKIRLSVGCELQAGTPEYGGPNDTGGEESA
ncbi:MAG TPA: hypothetical protein VGF96_04360 [Terracidiphilus sp.]